MCVVFATPAFVRLGLGVPSGQPPILPSFPLLGCPVAETAVWHAACPPDGWLEIQYGWAAVSGSGDSRGAGKDEAAKFIVSPLLLSRNPGQISSD